MVITDSSKFPKWDELYLPVLKKYSTVDSMKINDMIRTLHAEKYSDYSLDIKIASGSPLMYDRISWANYALFAGKFIERVKRWEYKISQKGIDWLKTWKDLTYDYLANEDDDYKNSTFHVWRKNSTTVNTTPVINTWLTPQEDFDNAFDWIQNPKKNELLQKCREIDPFIFEKIVWTLCEAMGYWTFIETPKSHDWWIDWIIKWDSLWFEKIYLQAKRYAEDNIVHWKEMTNFVWALWLTTVKKWIFFTTSSFSETAKKTAEDAKKWWKDIILIDWTTLVDLMFKYNIWVQVKKVYEVKDIDEDFFESFN